MATVQSHILRFWRFKASRPVTCLLSGGENDQYLQAREIFVFVETESCQSCSWGSYQHPADFDDGHSQCHDATATGAVRRLAVTHGVYAQRA